MMTETERHLHALIDEKDRRIAKMTEALTTIRDDYCDERAEADVKGDPPRYCPNDWMQMLQICEEALREQ